MKKLLEKFQISITDTISPSSEIDNYFFEIYTHHPQLTKEELQRFVILVHDYMKLRLPDRESLYSWHYEEPLHPTLQQTPQLLLQYEQLGKHIQQQLGHVIWLDFCQQAQQILITKGYFQPEKWVMEPAKLSSEEKVEPMQDPLQSAAAQIKPLLAHPGFSRYCYND